jgi:hypothetical protein
VDRLLWVSRSSSTRWQCQRPSTASGAGRRKFVRLGASLVEEFECLAVGAAANRRGDGRSGSFDPRREPLATSAGTAAEWGERGLSSRLGSPPLWPPASSVRHCGWPGARRQLFRTDHVEATAQDDTMLPREHVRDSIGRQDQQPFALSAGANDEIAAAVTIAADFLRMPSVPSAVSTRTLRKMRHFSANDAREL